MSNLPVKTEDASVNDIKTVIARLSSLQDEERSKTKDLEITNVNILYTFITRCVIEKLRAELANKPNDCSRWLDSNDVEALIITTSAVFDSCYTEMYTRSKKQKNLDLIVTALMEIILNGDNSAKDRIAATNQFTKMISDNHVPNGPQFTFVMNAPTHSQDGPDPSAFNF